MCSFTTDYEMQLAILISQNEGWYKSGSWGEVTVEEINNENGFKKILVKSHRLIFIFDMEGRFVSIVNYKD